MLLITKLQIIEGLRDARFLFLAGVVLASFAANGMIYADRCYLAMEDWREAIADTTRMLETRASNLQEISSYPQRMVKHPSALAFIADGGENRLPNTISVNAFLCRNLTASNRGNEMFPVLPDVDWVFIVGNIMTLMALLLSFATVCGEKRDGTLALVLSYPLSRLRLFLGKYLGLLAVLLLVLLLGMAVSLTIMLFSGALPLSEGVLTAIGWAVLLSALCLSFMLLLGMAVSSMVHWPAISLVTLMVFWLVAVFAVPGAARLLGENVISVPSSFDVQREQRARSDEIQKSAPERTFYWEGNPEYRFSRDAQNRAKYTEMICESRQRIADEAERARIRQADFILTFSWASPSGVLESALQNLCGTGMSGFRSFYETAQRYHSQLYAFAVEMDRNDPDTPHNVYSWGTSIDEGTFSTRPVEMGSFPRSHHLWLVGGLYQEQPFPLVQLLLLLAGNLQLAIIAFIALARYDPR